MSFNGGNQAFDLVSHFKPRATPWWCRADLVKAFLVRLTVEPLPLCCCVHRLAYKPLASSSRCVHKCQAQDLPQSRCPINKRWNFLICLEEASSVSMSGEALLVNGASCTAIWMRGRFMWCGFHGHIKVRFSRLLWVMRYGSVYRKTLDPDLCRHISGRIPENVVTEKLLLKVNWEIKDWKWTPHFIV